METQRWIRVGIVEDHPVVLEMLSSVMAAVPEIDVVATADCVGEAKKWFKPEELDVVVLDVELPDGNGVGLGVQMKRQNPHLGVLVFSDQDVLDLILGFPAEVRSGWSYLTKSETQSVEVLLNVLRLTARGESIITPTLINSSLPRPGSSLSRLTQRQLEVLRVAAQGESNQGIAQLLNISANSVGNHLNAIYETLEIPDGKNARVMAILEYLQGKHAAEGDRRGMYA